MDVTLMSGKHLNCSCFLDHDEATCETLKLIVSANVSLDLDQLADKKLLVTRRGMVTLC
jgi:hypothetical protein